MENLINNCRKYQTLKKIKQKQTNKINKDLKEYSINIWKDYLFQVKKWDSTKLNTQELLELEKQLGATFDYGGNEYAKFKIDFPIQTGIKSIREYKKTINLMKKTADKIKQQKINTPLKINNKNYTTYLLSQNYWGIRLKNPYNKKLTLTEIQQIEKQYKLTFIELNSYGYDFKINTEA